MMDDIPPIVWIVLVVLALGGAWYYVASKDSERIEAYCTQLTSLAHNAHDSLYAAAACQQAKDNQAQQNTDAFVGGAVAGAVAGSRH